MAVSSPSPSLPSTIFIITCTAGAWRLLITHYDHRVLPLWSLICNFPKHHSDFCLFKERCVCNFNQQVIIIISPFPGLDPSNLPSFIGTIIIAVTGCAVVALVLVLLAVACRSCLRWMRNKHREKQMNSYYAMQRPETPSSYTESTASTSQSITAVVNIVYATGDLLSYNKEPDLEIIEALYHFLPVILNHSEHSDAHDSVQRVKRNLQLLHCSLSLQGVGTGSGYDSDTTYSTTDDQAPLHTSQL